MIYTANPCPHEERASSLLTLAVGVEFEKCCYKFTSVAQLSQKIQDHLLRKAKTWMMFEK